ncbi:hypothetical protein BB559_000801 [Furculomyces boomerangus]|uniref:DNA polymerase delta subunit OB-fold domain-containing protein n=1 Tax=Furculomyces boomerangus TaxID=61424 RepID=A0A2T9Z3Z7_9FUNG|nr:hypothetical protein BB559_000801 [Furculomyces boomerangus]
MVSNNPQLARLKSNVDTTKNTFIITPESYQQQFSGIYRQRLQALWPRLVEAARSKWIEFDEGIEIMEKISSVSDICERVVLIGTVFLEQKLKPSILEEVSKSQWEKETPLPEKYWSEEDLVWLEDETGRINVISDPKGKIPVLITGMVVSVLGSSTKDGRFVVEDVEYAGMPVQSPVLDVSKDRQKHGKSEYVAIVSGFGVTGDSGVSRNMQLLADFLGGLLGGEEMRELSSKIGSLIVAGNSIDGRGVYGGKINEKMGKLGLRNTNDNVLGREVVVEKRSYVELDNYLSQIAGILPVILMPGDTDPFGEFDRDIKSNMVGNRQAEVFGNVGAEHQGYGEVCQRYTSARSLRGDAEEQTFGADRTRYTGDVSEQQGRCNVTGQSTGRVLCGEHGVFWEKESEWGRGRGGSGYGARVQEQRRGCACGHFYAEDRKCQVLLVILVFGKNYRFVTAFNLTS